MESIICRLKNLDLDIGTYQPFTAAPVECTMSAEHRIIRQLLQQNRMLRGTVEQLKAMIVQQEHRIPKWVH